MGDMTKNRAKIARERAGLSIGQAARMLPLDREALIRMEELNSAFADAPTDRMAEVYGVRVEWLTGEVERHDYDAMKGVKGYDSLTGHDRDAIAEFAASMPLRKVPECKDCGEPIAALDVAHGFETCSGCAAIRRALR